MSNGFISFERICHNLSRKGHCRLVSYYPVHTASATTISLHLRIERGEVLSNPDGRKSTQIRFQGLNRRDKPGGLSLDKITKLGKTNYNSTKNPICQCHQQISDLISRTYRVARSPDRTFHSPDIPSYDHHCDQLPSCLFSLSSSALLKSSRLDDNFVN